MTDQQLMNNLYIIKEVLYDYTPGMVVIAAPSLERCREIFTEEFKFSRHWPPYDLAIELEYYEVIENVNRAEGVVSYVYGGG